MAKIIFNQENRSVNINEETELVRLSYFDSTIPLKFGCRQGHCGTCAIKIIAGAENLSPKTKEEEKTLRRLKLGEHRLACQCAVKGDVLIDK